MCPLKHTNKNFFIKPVFFQKKEKNSNSFIFSTIMETPVSEGNYLEHLQNLEHKINFLKEQSFRDARSCNDVKDVVEKLKIKAVRMKRNAKFSNT